MLADGYTDIANGKLAVIVTCLEMMERAPARGGPLPPGLSIERIASPSTEWYRDLYTRVGGPWLWMSRLEMDDVVLTAILTDRSVEIWALMQDGRAEGLLELDFRVEGVCELAYFGLTEAVIGQGGGRFLMNHAIDVAWARPIRRFHVHTCSMDHPAALDFYGRSGFRAYKRQVEVFDDPRLTGVLPADVARHIPIIAP